MVISNRKNNEENEQDLIYIIINFNLYLINKQIFTWITGFYTKAKGIKDI